MSVCTSCRDRMFAALPLMTSVRWVVRTLGGSTTVYPSNSARSFSEAWIHSAGNPNAGSVVGMPSICSSARPAFIARYWLIRRSPRATSTPRNFTTYWFGCNCRLSRTRTVGSTMPKSSAIWRRIRVIRSSRFPASCGSTNGISPYPISSSIGSSASSGVTASGPVGAGSPVAVVSTTVAPPEIAVRSPDASVCQAR